MRQKDYYNTLSMSIPIILQSFFQILFGAADVWFLSFCSDTAVASVGYANQIVSVILLTYVIISSSISIVGAQYLGEKRTEDTCRISRDALACTLIASIFLTVILLIGNNLILNIMNIPNDMREGTRTYFIVISMGLVFQGGNTVFTAVYRIFARGRYAMYIGIFTNILNIIGDALVVSDPLKYNYDYILGVAAVTVFSNFAGYVMMCFPGNKMLKVRRSCPISAENIRLLLRYGIPAAGENISYKVSQLVVTMLLVSMGSYVLAAKIYAMNVMLFAALIPNSMGIATGIIVGYLYGEKEYEVLCRKCYKNIGIGIITVLVINLFIISASGLILSFFTTDQAVIEIAKDIICLEAFTLLFKVGNFMFSNSLKGVGDVYYCVALSVVSMWVFGVGASYILGIVLEWGIVGIYAGFCMDEAVRCMLMWGRWGTVCRKRSEKSMLEM